MTSLLPLLVLLPIAPLVWTWAFVLGTWSLRVRYGRRRGRPLPHRTWLAQVGVLWREVRALLRVQSWRLTRLWAHDLAPAVLDADAPQVLCVHGFTQDATNWLGTQRALAERGVPSRAVSLGFPPRRIAQYEDALRRALEEVTSADPRPLVVVCHSMGGVILRLVLDRHPELRARVHGVVTVATPHRGTAASRGVLLPETTLLRRDSARLHGLPTLPAMLPHADVRSIGSTDDATVYPESTTDAGGTHRTLTGVGHAGVIADPEGIAAIVDAVAAAAAPSTEGAAAARLTPT